MLPMQSDNAKLAREWRATAREDLRVAQLLAEESPSIAAFHAQQAAEKALRAACIAFIDDAPRTHVVNHLLDELVENGILVEDDVRDAGRLLERYHAPTRYPDALGGIDPNRIFGSADASGAVTAANVVMRFADQILERPQRRD